MDATIRKMGHSRGVLLPKAVIELLGIGDQLTMTIEDGAIVLRKPVAPQATADDIQDARRFRKLCELLQSAYDGNPVELEGLTVYCGMRSGWKNQRNVSAELLWTDERDEPLNLAAALDKHLDGVPTANDDAS